MVLQFLWRKDFLLHGTYSRKTLNILICIFNWLYFIQCLTSFSNPSANVFAFGDFNIHHKYWLTYSGGTDRPGELGYKFFNLKWLMTLIVLLLWIYIFLLVLVFVLQWFSLHSGHVIVSVSIDFLLNSKGDHHFIAWLFLSWLRRCSLSFVRCSMGGYFKAWRLCCCWWILWVSSG